MAITLTSAFLAELKKAQNTPDCVLEIILDNQTLYWGYHNVPDKSEVQPILQKISSLQNKIDPQKGYTTRGQITFTITGRDNFKNLIKNNYLKNRRVNRKEGFLATGFTYADYATTFTGKIFDWQRKGDELTITITDDMLIDAIKKLPVENDTNTQYYDFRNTNPVDIMTTMLTSTALLGVSTSYINSTAFTTEKDLWMSQWKFDRVITEPIAGNEYLNELQMETNSFIIHEGDKVGFKIFAPTVPGLNIEEYNDNDHLLYKSMSVNSGYKDNFYNRICIYYDYDESGSDNNINYESPYIASDAASQGAPQWNEIKTKIIKSKWLRTNTYTQPANITGCIIYHNSYNNGIGSGTLSYTAATKILTWTPPGGSAGTAVNITKNGKYQIFGSDQTKWVRVIITYANLPVGNQSDAITITALNASAFVAQLAQKILSRYRNPVSEITFSLDINNVAWNNQFIKPTDIKDITSDEAFEFGDSSWLQERIMITSIKPDFEKHKIDIEAIETKTYRRYGFIAPAGYPDYPTASAAQREYAFIGDINNKVNGGTEDGYYIW